MNVLISTLLYFIIMIICYNINKHLLILNLKSNNNYNWEIVSKNLFISILIIPSFFYWIIIGLYKIPNIPETPPKWL